MVTDYCYRSSLFVLKASRLIINVVELDYTTDVRLMMLKELRHGLLILKNVAEIFQVRHLQSVSIFFLLNHPRTFLAYST